MYQEPPSVVNNGEYHHIMYNYDTLKLPHDTGPTLKMTNTGAENSTLSGTERLTTVTFSEADTIVPSCLGTPLPVTNVLTSSSLNESVRLATPSLSVATPLTCSSINNGIPLRSVSLSAANSSSDANAHFVDSTLQNTLTVATMSEVVPSSVHGREDSLELGQIVHSSPDGVLDGNLVTSSSIDAVVTSMVASAECQGVVSTGRKLPSQVIAKLLGDDPLSLVRIIAEQDDESVSHQPQSFNMIQRPNMLVHTKLSDTDVVDENSFNDYHQVQVLNLRTSHKPENEVSAPCSVVWTCAYCNMAFSSSEAVRQHHEKDCTKNRGLAVTTATYESLMSPIKQVDDATYTLKLDKPNRNDKSQISDPPTRECSKTLDSNLENIWICTVCGHEFCDSDNLNKHHLSHSIQELSAALLKFTKPVKRPKKIDKPKLMDHPSVVAINSERPDPQADGQSAAGCNLLKEAITDNPGEDTPPHTPPQGNISIKVKKQSHSKTWVAEKKRGIKKLSKDAKSPKQRNDKKSVPGQGSRDPHSCHICNKVLSCRGNLAKHLVLHETEKPFVCKTCGLGFNSKRDQQYHYLQYHTNERPNMCKICGKGYVLKQDLIKHMLFHSKERKFACDMCGKQFVTAKCVNRHKKRHKREKIFKCPNCSKAFSVNADLKAHIRNIHQNSKKLANKKQQINSSQQKMTHSIQQSLEHDENQQPVSQSVKSKDITEFLLPSGTTLPTQLLPGDLESTAMNTTVASKDEVLITTDPIGSIIPLNEMPGGDYNTNGEHLGDHATYVMINSTEEDVASQNMAAAHGLNIMYTAPTQQVTDIGQGHMTQGNLNQAQHMLVSSSLTDASGQLRNETLHQHLDTQTELQHLAQETQTLASVSEVDLQESHQGDMSVGRNGTDHRTQLAAPSHDHSVVHTSQDPSNGFHLELLSQTIQLELQRTQSSAASYLGITER